MAELPSLARRGCLSRCGDGSPGARLIYALAKVGKSRRMRRASAIGNLFVMGCLGASFAPQTAFDQAGMAGVLAPPGAAIPWLVLLLAMSSAAASLMLLTAEREKTLPTPPGWPLSDHTAERLAGGGPQDERANSQNAVMMERMGHDLRTPLTAIIGFSDMMQCELHGPLGSDRYQSYAGHIRDSGVTLLQAIESAMALTANSGASRSDAVSACLIGRAALDVRTETRAKA